MNMLSHSINGSLSAPVDEPKVRWSVRLLAIAIILLLMSAVIEGTARTAYLVKRRLHVKPLVQSDLNEYQMPDSDNPELWRLRPLFSMPFGEIIAAMQKDGRTLGLQHLLSQGWKLKYKASDVIFRIDSSGFKGPELDPTHSRFRILTLGDSCTFGTLFDVYSYPRTMERELNALHYNVEVINGGVEGYSPKQVLLRIDEFKNLRPEITTIYLGWNPLYLDPNVEEHPIFYSVRAMRSAYSRLFSRKAALAAYNRPKHLNLNDPMLRRLDGYVPPSVNDVEEIVRQMQSVGSIVVLVTLPGLYSLNEQPSPLALRIGHLPEFTDNPYVLAKLTSNYNNALRDMASRHHLQLIDLDKWGESALRPRDAYFVDSVHLYEEGQQKTGQYMALQLESSLAAPNR